MSEDANSEYVLLSAPLNPMIAMALEASKLLKCYTFAGFTRRESLELVLSQLPEWSFPAVEFVDDPEEDDDELYEDVPDELRADGDEPDN